jgi:hypothetical protein
MKFFKKIIIVIISLITLVLITALFVNGEYHVEREISINQPNDIVFQYIKLLKNQDEYSVWKKMDPNMKKTFKGEDGTVGFISAWSSKNEKVGTGEQEITAIIENVRVDSKLRFKEPFEAEDNAYMATKPTSSKQTKVTWGFNGKMDYPMNLMMLFMDMDEMLGPDLNNGLKNLKKILESN